jgi:site-specific recombinase XerD
MVHLDRWLQSEGLEADRLCSDEVEGFFVARRELGRSNLLTVRSLEPLVGWLCETGAMTAPAAKLPDSPIETLVDRFGVYLCHDRGLVEGTVRFYVRTARRFLTASFGSGPVEPVRLSAGDVTDFVTSQCRNMSSSCSRQTVSALRSLLPFLRMEGLTVLALDQAVLSVAGWNSSLPRAVDARVVERLLAGCDRRRAIDRRDYAILMLLGRLGLRAGEVVALRLEDIDWRSGEILVRGKRRRQDRLPLPVDVGAALAAYLRRGRPSSSDRRVFLRHFAPHIGLEGSGAIRGVMDRACRRASVAYVNPHRLRHTVATELLRRGASLEEVGVVLRQSGQATTAIYAKVDVTHLGTVGFEWPEARS